MTILSRHAKTAQVLLFLVLSSGPSLAADWEYVTATGASNVYIDFDSLEKRAGPIVAAWFLFDHLDTRYDIDAARVYKSSKQRIEAHCATRNLTWTRIETFAGPLATGAKVNARNIDNQVALHLESIQPSAREAMAQALCQAANS